jgi:hypothetical protein
MEEEDACQIELAVLGKSLPLYGTLSGESKQKEGGRQRDIKR